jgi:hypothetical protein
LKNALGEQFHGQGVGGRRKGTLSLDEKPIAHEYLIQYFASFPKSILRNAAEELSLAFNKNISKKV